MQSKLFLSFSEFCSAKLRKGKARFAKLKDKRAKVFVTNLFKPFTSSVACRAPESYKALKSYSALLTQELINTNFRVAKANFLTSTKLCFVRRFVVAKAIRFVRLKSFVLASEGA